MKLGLNLLLFAEFVVSSYGASLAIPTSRLPGGVLWSSNNVGVVGGIPNVTTIYTNISPSGNAGTDWTNIQFALFNCPSNEVVYLNAGTYTLTNTVGWGPKHWFNNGANPGNNGVVLRGAGEGKTILNVGNNSDGTVSLQLIGNGWDNILDTNLAHLLYSAPAQGSTNLTLAVPLTGLTNGDYVCLFQENDPSLVQPHGEEPTVFLVLLDVFSNICDQLQWVQVTGVANGTNLTISPGAYMTNYQMSLHPQILWTGTHDPCLKMGIESLTINTTNQATSANENSTINLIGCFNCWVTNVEFIYPWFAATDWLACSHDTVENCYIHDTASGGRSSSYGWCVTTSSDMLCDNNAFYRITNPSLINLGSSGCVFAYNYCTNMIYGILPGFVPATASFHGAHPTMNLIEGNIGTLVSFDCIHGSSSHNTVFRNDFYGYQTNLGDLSGNLYTNFVLGDTLPVQIQSTNRYESIIGNVLGTPGYHTIYEDSVVNYPTNKSFMRAAIYVLGFWSGEGSFPDDLTNADPATVTTLWREGNYDMATLSTVWDTNGAVTLPSSLYLTSKPSWWGSSAWPSIGSDLTPMVGTIPAQLQFDAMGIPTAVLGGTGTGGGGTFGSWRTQ